MTKKRLRRTGGDHSPPFTRNLRLFLPVIAAGLLFGLALISPGLATALGMGISSGYLLDRMVNS
jgi:hypothetical protein